MYGKVGDLPSGPWPAIVRGGMPRNDLYIALTSALVALQDVIRQSGMGQLAQHVPTFGIQSETDVAEVCRRIWVLERLLHLRPHSPTVLTAIKTSIRRVATFVALKDSNNA